MHLSTCSPPDAPPAFDLRPRTTPPILDSLSEIARRLESNHGRVQDWTSPHKEGRAPSMIARIDEARIANQHDPLVSSRHAAIRAISEQIGAQGEVIFAENGGVELRSPFGVHGNELVEILGVPLPGVEVGVDGQWSAVAVYSEGRGTVGAITTMYRATAQSDDETIVEFEGEGESTTYLLATEARPRIARKAQGRISTTGTIIFCHSGPCLRRFDRRARFTSPGESPDDFGVLEDHYWGSLLQA